MTVFIKEQRECGRRCSMNISTWCTTRKPIPQYGSSWATVDSPTELSIFLQLQVIFLQLQVGFLQLQVGRIFDYKAVFSNFLVLHYSGFGLGLKFLFWDCNSDFSIWHFNIEIVPGKAASVSCLGNDSCKLNRKLYKACRYSLILYLLSII